MLIGWIKKWRVEGLHFNFYPNGFICWFPELLHWGKSSKGNKKNKYHQNTFNGLTTLWWDRIVDIGAHGRWFWLIDLWVRECRLRAALLVEIMVNLKVRSPRKVFLIFPGLLSLFFGVLIWKIDMKPYLRISWPFSLETMVQKKQEGIWWTIGALFMRIHE